MTNILSAERFFCFCFIIFGALAPLKAQNTALNFDGVNDYVNCGNFLPLSYTKEAWISISDLTLDNNILSGSVGSLHAFWAPSIVNNKLSAGHNGNHVEVQDPTPLLANTWYHVAVTYDAPSTTMVLYKNGIEVNRNTFAIAGNSNAQVLIGSYSAGLNLFGGSIDEVRIWSVARTGAEIAANMTHSIGAPQANLLANYRFNQGVANGNNTSITSLVDDSGNNRSGTFSGFSFMGIHSNFVLSDAVVPVNLLKFQAKYVNNAVQLAWQTATEMNNKGFYVERLNGLGNIWETLDFISAKRKAASYDFVDKSPLNTNYYRLRQVDDDGKEVLSKVVSIKTSTSKEIKIYSTLVFDVLNVVSDEANFHIFNVLGRMVLSGKNNSQIDVSALPEGTYILKMGDEQAKFIKQ